MLPIVTQQGCIFLYTTWQVFLRPASNPLDNCLSLANGELPQLATLALLNEKMKVT